MKITDIIKNLEDINDKHQYEYGFNSTYDSIRTLINELKKGDSIKTEKDINNSTTNN